MLSLSIDRSWISSFAPTRIGSLAGDTAWLTRSDRLKVFPPSFEIALQISYVPSRYTARHISPSTPFRENSNAGFYSWSQAPNPQVARIVANTIGVDMHNHVGVQFAKTPADVRP